MRLTLEEDRETIKRYAHIRPGGNWGSGYCAARCPGTARTCTLKKEHRGPHVAHDLLKRVVAVWDGGSDGRRPESRRSEPRRSDEGTRTTLRRRPGKEVWSSGFPGALGPLWDRFVRFITSVEEVALFVLLVGFVIFAVGWLMKIFPIS